MPSIPSTIKTTLIVGQGPAGPASGGAGSGHGPVLEMDLTGSRYWYLRFADRIKRIDQGNSPPVVQAFLSASPTGDWPNRQSLIYA